MFMIMSQIFTHDPVVEKFTLYSLGSIELGVHLHSIGGFLAKFLIGIANISF